MGLGKYAAINVHQDPAGQGVWNFIFSFRVVVWFHIIHTHLNPRCVNLLVCLQVSHFKGDTLLFQDWTAHIELADLKDGIPRAGTMRALPQPIQLELGSDGSVPTFAMESLSACDAFVSPTNIYGVFTVHTRDIAAGKKNP